MEARGWEQLSQRVFGSRRKRPGLETRRLGPGLHSSTPRSLERRCDPFLMIGLSFAEVETSVLEPPTHTPPASWVPGQTLHNLSRTEKCLVVKLANAGCAVILKILMTA